MAWGISSCDGYLAILTALSVTTLPGAWPPGRPLVSPLLMTNVPRHEHPTPLLSCPPTIVNHADRFFCILLDKKCLAFQNLKATAPCHLCLLFLPPDPAPIWPLSIVCRSPRPVDHIPAGCVSSSDKCSLSRCHHRARPHSAPPHPLIRLMSLMSSRPKWN